MNNDDIDNDMIEMGDDTGIVQLVKGVTQGEKFWAYIVMDPLKYEEYIKKVEQNEVFDLTQYGEVLESGWGDDPPDEIRQEIAEEFGFQDDFAQQVLLEIDQLEQTVQ